MKQEFLALKWVIAEQFHEYLLWKPFFVRTDNNLLTYIISTPNLDATQHWWVESLAGFTFSIEYQSSCRCPEPSHIKTRCRNHEVHPAWGHHVNNGREDAHEQWWPRLMKKYTSQSRNLWIWFKQHVWIYMWLIGWPPNRRIQYSRPRLSGSLAGKYRI